MELSILLFIAVGFAAQMIDGCMGMAYGVSSNTFLLSIGVPPAVASASVHTAEVFTTAISGFSHFKLGNFDKNLFFRIVLPGVLGGILGAYILTHVAGDVIKPFISGYLIIMGLVILWKAIRRTQERELPRLVLIPLGVIGGFFDAVGGGGWGPIVTTTVIAGGHNPRLSIGTVNASEFFVTLAEAVTFIITIPALVVSHWQTIVGLLVGGAAAAPLAAFACRRLPARALMAIVGLLIIGLSIRTIVLAVQ